MVNGKKEGKGKLEKSELVTYEGDFKNDLYNSYGILKYYYWRIYEENLKKVN